MESVVEKPQKIGLTEYEAKVCKSAKEQHELDKCVKHLIDTFETIWKYL